MSICINGVWRRRSFYGNGKTYDFDEAFFTSVFNQLTTNIFIKDAETDVIVYMNDAMKREFGQIHPEGKRCWMIEDARRENITLTVALIDVNGLKKINDQCGHGEGDNLLTSMACVTKGCLGEQDIIFRLSGDEFVLVFYNQNQQAAEKLMREISRRLHDEREKYSIFYEATFSYGLMEVYPGDRYTLSDIIRRADQQMYIQKRSYHIMRAKEGLLKDGQRRMGTLELTETYLIKEDAGTRDILEKMKKMGINLAMDNFGIGYSSLFSLKNIPVDIVKIDRGFVKGITSELFNATFVRAIMELCHDMGKKVCLEGVETKEEYDVVKNSGLELIQGFYFGYPINAEMFEKQWL